MRNLIDDPHPEFTASMMAHEKRRSWLETNIAACRRLLASCSDEDAMAAMSLAGQINDWEDQLTEILSGTAAKPSTEPAGGVSGPARSTVRAGSGNRSGELPMQSVRAGNLDKEPADWLSCRIEVHNTYAAALRAMGPDPIPLAGTEPWEEPIRDYGARLQRSFPAVDLSVLRPDILECFGETECLPRARLVPTQQEPRP